MQALLFASPVQKGKIKYFTNRYNCWFFFFENPFELTEVVIRHIIVTFDIFCEQNLSQCGKR